MQSEAQGDWSEYRRLILQELQRLHEDINAVKTQIGLLRSEVAVLQFKSGVWGLLAGAVPGFIAAIWIVLKG